MSLAAEKKRSGLCCYLWRYLLIMIVQWIQQGQLVIPTGSIIRGNIPFYWILLKEANLLLFSVKEIQFLRAATFMLKTLLRFL